MADIGIAVTYILVIEDTHDVTSVSVKLIIQIDLTRDAHRVLQEVAIDILRPFWLVALHRQVQVERLADTLLIGQIDNLVIRTDVQVLADRCRDAAQSLWCHHVAVVVEREPPWTVLNRIGMAGGTVVVERQVHSLTGTILGGVVESVHQPLQTAVGYKVAGCLRRSHHVAVAVLYITQRHIDVAVVQLGSRLVEIDQQLVALADEAEVQVRHVLVGYHRSCHIIADMSHNLVDVIHEQVVADRYRRKLIRLRVLLIPHVALVIKMYLLAIYIRCHHDFVVRIALLLVKA